MSEDETKKPEAGGVPEQPINPALEAVFGTEIDSISRILYGMYELESQIRDWAISKGWLVPGVKRNPYELLMLITSELGEACEAYRTGNTTCDKPGMNRYSNAEEELADAVIRILQMSAEYGYDVPGAIIAKMQYNKGRPFKHGKQA